MTLLERRADVVRHSAIDNKIKMIYFEETEEQNSYNVIFVFSWQKRHPMQPNSNRQIEIKYINLVCISSHYENSKEGSIS